MVMDRFDKILPLCKKGVKTVIIPWMHGWEICGYCLLKLPPPKYALKALNLDIKTYGEISEKHTMRSVQNIR